ncbi:hypothetical protein NECAME_11911 [Necator americanus]|uniref:ZP domain-containing protein n=1 Tax=Necator americanus TaxID=51031 RepID=W2T2H7_NECAM|nr:hypothetical protein NECAME_11911 [Necator americanus]ETN76108.1 hypothetical protein NECAME_11911 [Necator americanus]
MVNREGSRRVLPDSSQLQILPDNYRLDKRVENEVIGTPDVQCNEDAITFSVRTSAPFRGNIYVKGHYGIEMCRQEYYGNDFAGATFVVRIGDCGMRRIRQLQPHGMNYVLTFVTNFHPHFMTKVDRAYNVRCFYAYIDKTVNTDMEPPNCPLIPRSEFLPNSVVDPSVNPTQVIATFEGTLRSSMGSAVLDGTLQPPVYTPEFEAGIPWRKEQDSMSEDNNDTETAQQTTSVPTTSETQSVEARHTTLKMLTTEPPPEQSTIDWVGTTETNELFWKVPEISHDHPLEIFVKSTSAAPIIRPASERSGRRLADQIIDVMTEELTLRPVDDPSTAEAVHASAMPPTSQLTCLNQTALFASCTAFATLTVLCMVLFAFIFRDICRGMKRSSSQLERLTITSLRSGCSSESGDSVGIDRRSDLPIYARRLGDPSYNMMTAGNY